MKLKGRVRSRLFAVLLAAATALLALGFTFSQGFEVNTENWFALGMAVVNRILAPSASTDYNGNGTSKYADNVSAASGSYLGRVTSAVSVGSTAGCGSCTIDTPVRVPTTRYYARGRTPILTSRRRFTSQSRFLRAATLPSLTSTWTLIIRTVTPTAVRPAR